MPLRNDASLAASEVALFVEKAVLATGEVLWRALTGSPGKRGKAWQSVAKRGKSRMQKGRAVPVGSCLLCVSP